MHDVRSHYFLVSACYSENHLIYISRTFYVDVITQSFFKVCGVDTALLPLLRLSLSH